MTVLACRVVAIHPKTFHPIRFEGAGTSPTAPDVPGARFGVEVEVLDPPPGSPAHRLILPGELFGAEPPPADATVEFASPKITPRQP